MANINQVATYYKFNEASTNGTADEIVDSSFIGTASGQALQAVNLIEAGGKFDNLLDGSNGTASLSLISDTTFAISTWIKPTASDIEDGWKCVLQKPNIWYFEFNGNGLIYRNYAGGLDESGLHTALNNYTGKDGYKADVSTLTAMTTDMYNNGTLTQEQHDALMASATTSDTIVASQL